jgi:hypothetical protein
VGLATLDAAGAGTRPPLYWTKATSSSMVAGRPLSYWAVAGNPGPGSFNGTLNGVTVSGPIAGALPRADPASGASYVFSQTAGAIGQNGCLLLCDRLWHNGGYTITSTAAQNSTTPTWPSRCPTSFTDDTPATTGYRVLLGVEVSAQTGAGTPTITVGYTNDAGTAGRTATNVQATAATSVVQTFYQIGLQAGDTGVRSVQSLTLSATWTSGTINLVAYRVLQALTCIADGSPTQVDWFTGGGPRVYDGSCLFYIFVPRTTTATQISGLYVETQG